jgi:D-amino-acid dehydrogenase
VIGEAPNAAGVHFAFGHHHIRLTGGPKTGRLLADLVAGRRPDIDLAPYRPDRFDGP